MVKVTPSGRNRSSSVSSNLMHSLTFITFMVPKKIANDKSTTWPNTDHYILAFFSLSHASQKQTCKQQLLLPTNRSCNPSTTIFSPVLESELYPNSETVYLLHALYTNTAYLAQLVGQQSHLPGVGDALLKLVVGHPPGNALLQTSVTSVHRHGSPQLLHAVEDRAAWKAAVLRHARPVLVHGGKFQVQFR